jgi:hypothetical protein
LSQAGEGDRLPPEHHVARHCRKNDLIWSGAVAIGIQECALVVTDPDGLSVSGSNISAATGAGSADIRSGRRRPTSPAWPTISMLHGTRWA